MGFSNGFSGKTFIQFDWENPSVNESQFALLYKNNCLYAHYRNNNINLARSLQF